MSEKKDEFLSSLDHLITVNIAAFNEHQEASGSIIRATRATAPTASELNRKFQIGGRVRKTKGSSWQGVIVGFYSTELTPIGYCVESEREPGSVQIYPEAALSNIGEA